MIKKDDIWYVIKEFRFCSFRSINFKCHWKFRHLLRFTAYSWLTRQRLIIQNLGICLRTFWHLRYTFLYCLIFSFFRVSSRSLERNWSLSRSSGLSGYSFYFLSFSGSNSICFSVITLRMIVFRHRWRSLLDLAFCYFVQTFRSVFSSVACLRWSEWPRHMVGSIYFSMAFRRSRAPLSPAFAPRIGLLS